MEAIWLWIESLPLVPWALLFFAFGLLVAGLGILGAALMPRYDE